MDDKRILVPKYLTPEVAAHACNRAFWATANLRRGAISGLENCHIVVLVPSMPDDSDTNFASWPNYAVEPHALYEHSQGAREEWRYRYDEIAQCKALQLWHGRNEGGATIMPHLLFSGDTPYWGGVKRDGIVVACSGYDEWIDRMIAGIVADLCIGLAYDAWMASEDRKQQVEFLT